MRIKASGYADTKQFRHRRRMLNRQSTILGIVIPELQRKMQGADCGQPAQPKAVKDLCRPSALNATMRNSVIAKTSYMRCMSRKSRALAKARRASPMSSAQERGGGLTPTPPYAGARTFPGNPYDGNIVSAVLEQATNLTQDLAVKLKHIESDLVFRGVDAKNPNKIIQRGKFKCLSVQQKGWLKRSIGDALHFISCAACYNLRWPLRAISRLDIRPIFFA